MNNKKPELNKKLNNRIRQGDKVIAIAGNFRGQTGTVLKRMGDKAVVQGLNVRKKHVKADQANPKGGIVELEKPIHLSNLRVCDALDKPLKLKCHVNDKGERELCYNADGKNVVYRSIKKS
jgi:large subunit ribosomal protein L24